MKKLLKDVLIWFLWYPVRWIVSFLPLRVVYLIGDAGGWVLFKTSRNTKKIMVQELQTIFREDKDAHDLDLDNVISRTFRLGIKNRLEVLLYDKLTRQKALKFLSVASKEILDAELARNKGVILLIAHFGANKHVMPALGYNSYKINQVAGKPIDWRDQLEKLGHPVSPILAMALKKEFEVEHHLPADFIYVFESLRPIFRKLKNNEIVCFAVDGGGGDKRVKAKFLGREVQIPTGPFSISRKTGAPLVPAFIVRQKDNKHILYIEKPLELNSRENGNIDHGVQQLLEILESYIKKYPCHYLNKLKTMRIMKEYGDNTMLRNQSL